MQEEYKRKNVYKQTCLASELERILQYVQKSTCRQKNMRTCRHTCICTHTLLQAPTVTHIYLRFYGSQKMLQNQMRIQQRHSHFSDIIFLKWYIHFLNQHAFHPKGLLWGGGKEREEKKKVEKRQGRLQFYWLNLKLSDTQIVMFIHISVQIRWKKKQ